MIILCISIQETFQSFDNVKSSDVLIFKLFLIFSGKNFWLKLADLANENKSCKNYK